MASSKLGRLRQWAEEKISAKEKPVVSEELKVLERDIELRKDGIQRLILAAQTFHHALSKKKSCPAALDDAHAEKMLPVDVLGMVMIRHGEEFGDESPFGTALIKLGRAHCKIATLQEAFALTLHDTFLRSMERFLDEIREYEALRKKLESRRLALEAATAKFDKLQHSKREKERERREVEDELERTRQRYEETAEDIRAHMHAIQENEHAQRRALIAFLALETNYAQAYVDVLREVRGDVGGVGEDEGLGGRSNSRRSNYSTASSSKDKDRDANATAYATYKTPPLRPSHSVPSSVPSTPLLRAHSVSAGGFTPHDSIATTAARPGSGLGQVFGLREDRSTTTFSVDSSSEGDDGEDEEGVDEYEEEEEEGEGEEREEEGEGEEAGEGYATPSKGTRSRTGSLGSGRLSIGRKGSRGTEGGKVKQQEKEKLKDKEKDKEKDKDKPKDKDKDKTPSSSRPASRLSLSLGRRKRKDSAAGAATSAAGATSGVGGTEDETTATTDLDPEKRGGDDPPSNSKPRIRGMSFGGWASSAVGSITGGAGSSTKASAGAGGSGSVTAKASASTGSLGRTSRSRRKSKDRESFTALGDGDSDDDEDGYDEGGAGRGGSRTSLDADADVPRGNAKLRKSSSFRLTRRRSKSKSKSHSKSNSTSKSRDPTPTSTSSPALSYSSVSLSISSPFTSSTEVGVQEDTPASTSTSPFTSTSTSTPSTPKILKPPSLASQAEAEAQSQRAPRKVVRALYDFVATSPDELSFRKGERIGVIQEVVDEWWLGEVLAGAGGGRAGDSGSSSSSSASSLGSGEGRGRRRGLFPRSYTEVVGSSSSAAAVADGRTSSTSPVVGDATPAGGKPKNSRRGSSGGKSGAGGFIASLLFGGSSASSSSPKPTTGRAQELDSDSGAGADHPEHLQHGQYLPSEHDSEHDDLEHDEHHHFAGAQPMAINVRSPVYYGRFDQVGMGPNEVDRASFTDRDSMADADDADGEEDDAFGFKRQMRELEEREKGGKKGFEAGGTGVGAGAGVQAKPKWTLCGGVGTGASSLSSSDSASFETGSSASLVKTGEGAVEEEDVDVGWDVVPPASAGSTHPLLQTSQATPQSTPTAKRRNTLKASDQLQVPAGPTHLGMGGRSLSDNPALLSAGTTPSASASTASMSSAASASSAAAATGKKIPPPPPPRRTASHNPAGSAPPAIPERSVRPAGGHRNTPSQSQSNALSSASLDVASTPRARSSQGQLESRPAEGAGAGAGGAVGYDRSPFESAIELGVESGAERPPRGGEEKREGEMQNPF